VLFAVVIFIRWWYHRSRKGATLLDCGPLPERLWLVGAVALFGLASVDNGFPHAFLDLTIAGVRLPSMGISMAFLSSKLVASHSSITQGGIWHYANLIRRRTIQSYQCVGKNRWIFNLQAPWPYKPF